MSINAGKLDRMVRIMELAETETGWKWAERRKAWANVRSSGKTSVFSSINRNSIFFSAGRTVSFIIRRQSIDPGCVIVWDGQHYFITAVDPAGDKLHLTVTAAMVRVASCVSDAHKTPKGKSFPAAIAEKYVRYGQPEPMATGTVCYVLAAPKEVVLKPGGLVDVEGRAFQVLCAHKLDPYRNEYEISRKEDL